LRALVAASLALLGSVHCASARGDGVLRGVARLARRSNPARRSSALFLRAFSARAGTLNASRESAPQRS